MTNRSPEFETMKRRILECTEKHQFEKVEKSMMRCYEVGLFKDGELTALDLILVDRMIALGVI